MHVNVLDFIFCLLMGVGLGAEKCSARNRSGSALRISLRLRQSCTCFMVWRSPRMTSRFHRTNTTFCEQMRRTDGVLLGWADWLGRAKGRPLDQREVLSGWLS